MYQQEEFEAFLDPYKDGLPEEVEDQLAARYEELFRIFYDHRDQIAREHVRQCGSLLLHHMMEISDFMKADLIGSFAEVEIVSAGRNTLRGRLIEK